MVILVDFVGLFLALLGFHLAFRQRLVRRLWHGWQGSLPKQGPAIMSCDDPIHSIMLIAGVMVMAFGIAIALMVTLFHLESAQ